MEFQKKGSLADIIRKTPNKLDNTIRQIILLGIAYGMNFLHSQDVIHRDLKLENIVLDENNYPKIIDFGAGKFLDKDSLLNTQSTQIGTLLYMSPEYLNDNFFVKKSDVYSFSFIIFEVVTGIKPYERPSFEDIIKILVFNIDDSIVDFYDEEEEDDETNKYLLDGVDLKRYQNYIENVLGMKTEKPEDDEKNSEYFELSKKVNNLEQKVNSLEHKNRISRSKYKRIKTENEQLNKEIKSVKSTFHKMKEEVLSIFGYIKNLESNINDMKNNIEDWKMEMIAMKRKQDKKIAEITAEFNSLKNGQKIETNKKISTKPSMKKRGKSVQHIPKSSSIIEYKIEQEKKSPINNKSKTVNIPYKPSSKLSGIINHLNYLSNGIVSLNGVVQVTCSSTKPNLFLSAYDCKFLCDFTDLSEESMWSPNNEKNGYVQFDFAKNSVNVSFYT